MIVGGHDGICILLGGPDGGDPGDHHGLSAGGPQSRQEESPAVVTLS
jgi:hypothetical protein